MSGVEFVGQDDHVLYHTDPQKIEPYFNADQKPPAFELAGPRHHIYFDPAKLNCGIVTCGGLCPGLNDVIRAMVMGLHYH
jgi:6-phosphofructokinase 1